MNFSNNITQARDSEGKTLQSNGSAKVAGWPDPLGGEAFYGLAGEIIKRIEPHTEADPAALLIQLLVAFGSVVGRGPHFKVEADEHHGNLFACLVGETAKARKGTSLGHVLKIFQGVDLSWVDCVHSGLSTGEGLISVVRDETVKKEPVREKNRIVSYQDVITDQGIKDKRALVIQSEFAGTLRVLARDGNTLSAILRDAWDGRDLRVMTKNSPVRATQPHISIVGHITKNELNRYLNETEAGNGFANRFLWVSVKRSKILPEGGRLSEPKVFDSTFKPLIEQLKMAVDFARGTGQITFDEEARELWHEIYRELSEGKAGMLGAITARADPQTIRLASVYALLDQSERIRREHLLAALAVWDYCMESAAYIFGNSTGNRIADKIRGELEKRPGGMTRTQIVDHLKRHTRHREIEQALDLLARTGTAICTVKATGGRPCERWVHKNHCKAN